MKRPEDLRSHRWFGPDDLRSFGHRSKTRQMGYLEEEFRGRPVIGILNTWSDLNTCHTHLRERAEAVKRGVWQAGGFPVEVPVLSLGEMLMKPTTMLYRNLLAMETEEVLRCHPIDGAVLLGGCDKTTPALLMGAITMDLPALFVSAGPMIKGYWRGEELGSGSDVWKYWTERRAGNLCDEDWSDLESAIARSPGHCMTMGTASTMTALTEVLGLALPGSSSIPAVHSAHTHMAVASGRRIVDMVREDLKPSDLLSAASFDNAIRTLMALGGSTNAIIHLIAIARRAGIGLTLDAFDRLSRETPVLANLKPGGVYLMDHFYEAGGLRGLLSRIADLLNLDCPTALSVPLGESLQGASVFDDDVILPRAQPRSAEGGVYVLRGNLAPDGCVIKPSAASMRLYEHEGPAVVFSDYDDLMARIDTPELDVSPESVMVLQNAGPLGGPGMPEWGMLPIPKKLLQQGVRDMVRISDARMSGTSYGMCVLHVAPESHVGGPLALVRSGDRIRLSVSDRSLDLLVPERELAKRRRAWKPRPATYPRGYGRLHAQEVTQANEGCDFVFLHRTDRPVPEPDIH